MKEEKATIKFQFPPGLDLTCEKYDPELDIRKNAGESSKSLELVNKILEQTPVPQWIMDL